MRQKGQGEKDERKNMSEKCQRNMEKIREKI